MALNAAGEPLIIWILRSDALPAGVREVAEKYLSDEEREEAGRLVLTKMREQFVLSRALARFALGEHFGVAGGDWRFERNEFGKPMVAGPEGMRGCGFNLSHTAGLIVCVTCGGASCGVDVERMEARGGAGDLLELAGGYFSEREMGELRGCEGEGRVERFFRLWTLKEAYAKGRALGLQLDFRGVEFEVEGDGVRLSGEEGAGWRFWSWREGGYMVAVAVRAVAGGRLIKRRVGIGDGCLRWEEGGAREGRTKFE